MIRKALLFLCLIGCLMCSQAMAAFNIRSGCSVNASSNMLLRPDGESGAMTSLFLETDYYHKDSFSLGYSVSGAFLGHYSGIQYHRHTLTAAKSLKKSEKFLWNVSASARLSRFGEVTSLVGYHQETVSTSLKYYLTESLLFRSRLSVNQRLYKTYGRENYRETSGIFRIDRFFCTGTALRAQFDAGYRCYYKQASTPSSALAGISCRVAQSISPGWGIFLEPSLRKVHISGAKGGKVFNRIFLDDMYKYSSRGVTLGSTWIVKRLGTVQFSADFLKREYGGRQMSYFDYLPQDGWDEDEYRLLLSFSPHWKVIPAAIEPSLDIYYSDIDASFDAFSYDSTGMRLSLLFR